MNGIPQELDWVKRRAACTVEQVLSELMRGAEDDVAAANQSYSAPADQPLFKCSQRTHNSLFSE